MVSIKRALLLRLCCLSALQGLVGWVLLYVEIHFKVSSAQEYLFANVDFRLQDTRSLISRHWVYLIFSLLVTCPIMNWNSCPQKLSMKIIGLENCK